VFESTFECLVQSRRATSRSIARERVVVYEEHRDATIASEYAMFAGGVGGPAFEINWGVGALSRVSRVGFIPLRAGLVEFSVDSSAKNLGHHWEISITPFDVSR